MSSKNITARIGFKIICPGVFLPLDIDLNKACHWLIVGGSGSGKSVFLLYVLNSLITHRIGLFIADFKGSGDFIGLTSNYAQFEDCVDLIEKFYIRYQDIKHNKTGEKILLIFDELGGFMIWLESMDKKKANEIKGKMAEILMQGRELPGGGSAWLWSSLQRADNTYFSHGARDNYMIVIALGRISKESKGMLFSGEDIPDYTPAVGRGLILQAGKPITIFQVPQIKKKYLMELLRHKAADQRSGVAAKQFRRLT